MNASITVDPPVSLQVWCSDNQQGRPIEQEVYRPGDIISAWTEVRIHQSFEALSLHASLIGISHPKKTLNEATTDVV